MIASVPSVIVNPAPALIVNVSLLASESCSVEFVPPFCDCILANAFWLTSAPSSTLPNPRLAAVNVLLVALAAVMEPILFDVNVNVSNTSAPVVSILTDLAVNVGCS